jgi:hypothetical protein
MPRKAANGEEAAAVAAAIARFEAEFGAAPTAEAEPRLSAWQRMALLEGVNAKGTVQDPGGGAKWLS